MLQLTESLCSGLMQEEAAGLGLHSLLADLRIAVDVKLATDSTSA